MRIDDPSLAVRPLELARCAMCDRAAPPYDEDGYCRTCTDRERERANGRIEASGCGLVRAVQDLRMDLDDDAIRHLLERALRIDRDAHPFEIVDDRYFEPRTPSLAEVDAAVRHLIEASDDTLLQGGRIAFRGDDLSEAHWAPGAGAELAEFPFVVVPVPTRAAGEDLDELASRVREQVEEAIAYHRRRVRGEERLTRGEASSASASRAMTDGFVVCVTVATPDDAGVLFREALEAGHREVRVRAVEGGVERPVNPDELEQVLARAASRRRDNGEGR